jgi:hypothetical protein
LRQVEKEERVPELKALLNSRADYLMWTQMLALEEVGLLNVALFEKVDLENDSVGGQNIHRKNLYHALEFL